MRSITCQTEECTKRKPRFNDHVFSFQEYTGDSTITEQRDVDHEALSQHDQGSANKRLNSPNRKSRNLPLPIVTATSGMVFSYPRFNGETDVASHIRLFLNVWNANHMAQRFPEAEAHKSKVVEFRLTLDGRVACWNSQMDLVAITTFDQLQSALLRFFDRRVPQREIIGQFYTIKQLRTESIADFSLRFQSLRRQLTRALIDEEARETFLAALRRLVRTTLNMHSVKGETADMTIERALQLKLEEEDEGLSMASLRQALTQEEEH